MGNFADYYKNLLGWEGGSHSDAQLIGSWNQIEVKSIENDFTQAMLKSGIKTQTVPITLGSTNQSIGNQVAEFFASHINRYLQRYRVTDCPGAGYPDKKLIEIATNRIYAFELKATSQWNPKDSNRRVLTSSSKKLRQSFVSPINHVLATCCYTNGNERRITAVRFDFIEPTTEVDIRLEASVNHKSLSEGVHQTSLF